jgi:hypothetical protein
MSSLQTYLALIDPLLFTVLKAVRRTFEAGGSGVEWAIAGDLAMYLYAYSAGMSPVNLKTGLVDIRVKVNKVDDVSHLDGVVSELVKLGFKKTKESELVYPLCSIRIVFTDVKSLDVVWMKNLKGKSTYPLLKPEEILDKKQESIKQLPLSEMKLQLEVQSWMKEVMNHLVIE